VCVCYSKMTYESWHLTSPYVEIALIGLVVMVLRLCGRERFVRISARLIAFPRPTISTLAWLDLTEAHSHWRFKNAAQITNTELTRTPHLNAAGRDPSGFGRNTTARTVRVVSCIYVSSNGAVLPSQKHTHRTFFNQYNPSQPIPHSPSLSFQSVVSVVASS